MRAITAMGGQTFYRYVLVIGLTASLFLNPVVTHASPSKSSDPSVSQVLRFSRDDDHCKLEENNRFDCWPEVKGATEKACEKRGCCWKAKVSKGAPRCYFPSDNGNYTASSVKETASGKAALISRSDSTFFPPDITNLQVQIDYQTESRLRIKIFDPKNARFEPPVPVSSAAKKVKKPLYKVTVKKHPFSITVARVSTGATVFDSTGMAPLIFADQFLQIGTRLSTDSLYSLGSTATSSFRRWTCGGGLCSGTTISLLLKRTATEAIHSF